MIKADRKMFRFGPWLILLFLPLLLAPAAWGQGSVVQVRVGIHPQSTRLVLELSQPPADYSVRLLAAPPRIAIALTGIGGPPPALPRGMGLARRLAATANGDPVRFEVLLTKPAKLASVKLIGGSSGPSTRRLVVDIAPATTAEFATALAAQPPTSPQPPVLPQPAIVSAAPPVTADDGSASSAATGLIAIPLPLKPAPTEVPLLRPGSASPAAPVVAQLPAAPQAPNLPLTLVSAPASVSVDAVQAQPPAAAAGYALGIWPPSVPQLRPEPRGMPLIYIDPGHGGADPGTIGPDGAYEKTITLAVAKELQRELIATGRYRAKLTRNGDQYVPLRPRFEMARDEHADLFISLHVNSAPAGDPRGLSVYTLSETGSDSEADALAAKENKADLISGVDLTNQTRAVTSILIDLAQRESKNQSAHFAELLLHDLGQITPLLQNSHRFAGFAVLKAPDVPSVLVELGYITDSQDEAELLSPSHRAKLAAAMLRAIDEYFLTVASSKS
jgi:N-acetylmuramoyl-L-alanine amidase